jgi:hypothetical protein
MKQNEQYNYYAGLKTKSFPEQKQLITYTYNDVEHTITGNVEEKDGFIYLYQYRDKYVGTEFFISFSKNSSTYKLVKVTEAQTV